jgi:signal transduction histidine kinase
MKTLLDRLAHNLAKPAIGLALAIALLAAGLAIGLYNERVTRAEKMAELQVQADILAATLAGPLAFDDESATREYIDALRARPDITAIGAYGPDGKLVAGFARGPGILDRTSRLQPPAVVDGQIMVTAPVVQTGTRLGSVRLASRLEQWQHRASRYLGIAAVIIMASLLVATLATFYARATTARQRLEEEMERRREAEDALRQSQKMEAMGQLTGGVAHDFNNLLMVASSGLDLLDRTDNPERRARLNQGIRHAIDRGAKLTQQLLTFARRSPLTPEVVDLGARLRTLQPLLERSLRENVVIDLQLPAGLWPIEVDASQLEVAILNIAINARDAMPNGGTLLFTAANQRPQDPDGPATVRLSICDTGEGIAPELLEKVFEPFFTTKGVGSGTGLGLSQVYGFVRAAGGQVVIESELGKGTAVTMTFPRSSKPLPHRIYRHQPMERVAGDVRVLITEDDDHVAELVSEMLAELGYATARVGDAAAALTLLTTDRRFDVVLSDMIMPGGMNGLDLAREVERLYRDLPVVLMTGFSEAAAAAKAEGRPLLTKPYTINALAEAIRAVHPG